jgi:lipopolysaccharide transport system permease protein
MSTAVTMIAPPTDLTLRGDMTPATRMAGAMADIVGGARLWRLAMTLGWLDIRLRYRGSMLGPFWLTISTGVMVGALGILYSTLFKMDVHDYLPFLALSQILWGFLATLVSEACTTFTEAEGVIRSVRMVFAVFSIWPGWDGLLALPGLLIWVIDALALTLLLGAFCARFRDIQPIVNSLMQIAFFMTPVIWKPDQLSAASKALLPISPFFDLLEIVRGPILGTSVTMMTWVGAIGFSVVLCGVSWAFFARARGRVTFWI